MYLRVKRTDQGSLESHLALDRLDTPLLGEGIPNSVTQRKEVRADIFLLVSLCYGYNCVSQPSGFVPLIPSQRKKGGKETPISILHVV